MKTGVRHVASNDGLTLLPDRRLLMQGLELALSNAAAHGHYGAVLFFDLDHFRTLNDTLGHCGGDRLLRAVGARLLEAARPGDTVGYVGGDEFMMVIEGLGHDPAGARQVVGAIGDAILHVLGRPHCVNGHRVYATASIGATLFCANAKTIDEILKQADLAMYEAKAAGRHAFRFCDPALQQRVAESALLQEDLRTALDNGEFLLHYQPIVDAELRIRGAEALLRWHHPERGMVRPDVFIPIAERTDLILSLGRCALEQACIQLVHWAAQPETAHWTLAVNVSAREFRQPDFVRQTIGIVAGSGARPDRLRLELTESMLLDDVDDVAAKMAQLRALGVRFSLDDFGTGYSSLSYLKRLPLCQLKIDRAFVKDAWCNPNDAAIARAIIGLAASLGLEVVAEGVETTAQRDFLVANGCRIFQGFLFGRPAPVLDIVPQ